MDIQARNEAIGFCKKYIDEHGGGGGETSSEIATIVNKLGAKNLLINAGADNATNQGVTFTKNADGTVSATRVSSATNTATYNIVNSANLNTDHYANLGEVILSGTPADGSANICVMLRQTSGTGHIYYNGVEVVDTDGTGALVDLDHCTLDADGTTPIGRDDMRIIIRISKVEEPNNVVFKPMLRYKGIEDGTYVPYAKTNAEATTDLQKLNKLVNPHHLYDLPTDCKFNSFPWAGLGFRVNNDWAFASEGNLTLDNKVNDDDITLQYKLDVETAVGSTARTNVLSFIDIDGHSLIMDMEYLIIDVTVYDEGSDLMWQLKPAYFNEDYPYTPTIQNSNGTFKIGFKLPIGLVFTGFFTMLSSTHSISSGYSSTNYIKITGIKRTYIDTAYNACDYKF